MDEFYKSKYFCNKKSIIKAIFIFFIFLNLFDFSLCEDCPREKPILKDNECVSTYCSYADMEDNICVISNPFVKSQYLNDIHVFALEPISNICAVKNSKGDLLLMAQGFSEENAGIKYLFAFEKNGIGLFYDDVFKYHYSFERIKLPEDKNPETFYSVHIDDKEYLLSNQVGYEMFLIDFYNRNYSIYSFETQNFYSSELFRLKGYYDDEEIEDEDEGVYFINYVFCEEHKTYKDCFLGLRIFRFNLTSILTIKEINDEIQINNLHGVSCFQNDNLYIQCIYTKYEKEENTYNRVISLFNYKTLKLEFTEILEENVDLEMAFDSTIQLKGNSFVTGFSHPDERNIIKLLLKKMTINENSDDEKFSLENYLPNIDVISINQDDKYSINRGNAKRNSMVKINDSKFAILLNDYSDSKLGSSSNKNLLILICSIFNDSRISIRHYRINFELYNLLIYEDLRGYTLNDFFGVLLETTVNTEVFTPKAIFLTFGYVNSTYEDEVDKNLKLNNTDSVIVIENYIKPIENNLFGYKLIGVQILHLPNDQKSGYFINNETNERINEGDIVSIDTVLRFILTRKLNIEDDFTIEFAPVVQEPEYDEMNSNAERVDLYPVNDTESERQFYTPKKLLGRVVNYVFEIRCYESCNGCTRLSNDSKEQFCIQCKRGFHMQEGTNNCIQDIKCYPNCETCSGPPVNSLSMNCLSCKEGFHYFEESKNCLNCPKYVSYDLTRCIDKIPDGYYLNNEELGLLGKCHELCKTCDDGPELWGMNCIECKYPSSKFVPQYDGDCPTEYYDEYEEEDPWMPGGECPRNKPILIRNDFCIMAYCQPKEYEDGTCAISNSIVKSQWMNNIQRFGEGNIVYISASYGSNKELFLIGQKRDVNNNNFENIIYAVNESGQPLFYDSDKKEYHSFKNIEFPDDIFLEKVKYVKNYETNEEFLVSTQVEDKMYVINYSNGKTDSVKFDNVAYTSGDIIIFRKSSEYLTNFIHCENNDLNNCYMAFRKFKFNSKNELEVLKENQPDEKINPESEFVCVDGFDNFICSFTSLKEDYNILKIGIFDYANLDLQHDFKIEPSFKTNPFFNSLIKLNDKALVIAYSEEDSIIKVLIKSIIYDFNTMSPNLYDYIETVPSISLNEKNFYSFENADADRNSLCRINDDKFVILVNSFNDIDIKATENPLILIYIFNIFNENKNINVRKYSINFKLYNMINYGKIIGYNIDHFFGIIMELSSPEDLKTISSAFMTFGYVNTTESSKIFDSNFIPENSAYSKPIKFTDYIYGMQNNLFGYQFLGVIILELPNSKVGNFLKSGDAQVNVNDILSLRSEIKLKLNENYETSTNSITFAGVVKEAEYDTMNKYAEEIFTYPENSIDDEKDFYSPQNLIGKKIEYIFEVKGNGKQNDTDKCYPSCSTCYKYSEDDDNHLCKICKPDYYFKEDTYNCYQEINEHYYFDEENEIFSPCYVDCLTCSEKETSSTQMNCLSCEEDYNFYDKSKNCLQCPRYVNYLQTECIDIIPEGYYVNNEIIGTIEKCHDLCKTCSEGPSTDENDNLKMNCNTCKYEKKDFVPNIPGNCPVSGDDDKKSDDEPVDGQCSKEKPILKDNKCQVVYCTEKEYENGTCKKYNDYIKKQWLNNFHIFDDKFSSYVVHDINDYGEIFLMSQKENDNTYKKYLFGFEQNGRGILYDKNKKDYVSFKTISSKTFTKFTDKMKYIEIDNEGYLMNMIKDKQFYLINYDNDEVISLPFYNKPYSIDTMTKLKNKNNIYLFDFVYCLDEKKKDKCYFGLANYKVEDKNKFTLEKSNSEQDLINVDYDTKITCFQNNHNMIQCTYSQTKNDSLATNQYILGLFNSDTLELYQSFILENAFFKHPTFDSMIQLKNDACVIAYSNTPNTIKVLFKNITLDDEDEENYILTDYLEGIPEIILNKDKSYNFNSAIASRNSLYKLNDNKFAMLVNDCKDNIGFMTSNSDMAIIIFQIYNFNKNVIVRHYKIDFELYNMFIDGDLMGYTINGFFGLLVELTSPEAKMLSRAAFLTFGYINTTDDVSAEEGTKNIITDNKKIKVKDYIKDIENNLFGYELEGVKILSLPDENKAGYFLNTNSNNKRIKTNEIIDINSELSFVINEDPSPGEYTISFAGVAKEPEFSIQNNFANLVTNYPNSALPENYFDEQNSFVGKEFKYSFTIGKKEEEKKCFRNCATCESYSENIDSQNCLTCKEGFYFKDGTKNCYDKIETHYYFNEKTKTFSPCYDKCLTCSGKETDKNQMNCKSCDSSFNFYEKSTNCMKCPNYVNLEQTECLSQLPEGYYVINKNLGTISKCHNLCKTCITGPTEIGNKTYMNCMTCLYENKSVKLQEGNCPETPDNGNKENNNEEEKQDLSFLLVLAIIIILIVLGLTIGVIYYIKCYGKNKTREIQNGSYHSIDGKDIPFEDENNAAIN